VFRFAPVRLEPDTTYMDAAAAYVVSAFRLTSQHGTEHEHEPNRKNIEA